MELKLEFLIGTKPAISHNGTDSLRSPQFSSEAKNGLHLETRRSFEHEMEEDVCCVQLKEKDKVYSISD